MPKPTPPIEDDRIIETVVRLLRASGEAEAAAVLRTSRCRFAQTGYDNWDGGTAVYTLYVQVAPETHALLGGRRVELEKVITAQLGATTAQFSKDWYSAELVPLVVALPARPDLKGGPVSPRTRRNILDVLRIEGVAWQGRLSDSDFLAPLFDLEALSSTDERFGDAAGDIWQHRERNSDWDEDWLFEDERFDLVGTSDATFLSFVERLVDPVVRPDAAEAVALAERLNEQLRRDGWGLVETETLGGRPRFRVEPRDPAHRRAEASLRNAAVVLGSAWMHHELDRIEAAIDTDPSLAIGTAKELVETCCKHVADKLGLEIPANPDMPDLVKAVLKALELVPEGVPEAKKGARTIRRTLSNLSQVTQGLSELRQLYGTGHGRDSRHQGLRPRHARLAVAAAASFVAFIVATLQERVAQDTSDHPR